MEFVPLRLEPGEGMVLIDQTVLPHEERWLTLRDVEGVCEAIRTLRVRGAPLLGLAGAGALAIAAETRGGSEAALRAAADEILGTRPTAVDLGTVTRRALAAALAEPEEPQRAAVLWAFATGFAGQRAAEDAAIGAFGAELIAPGSAVLTHCNAGGLATAGIGTALGVVRAAFEQGRLTGCYATETRPLLQGARLTMWELRRAGIPATLLPDTAAASLIASGRVQYVVTGADRIAANGDAANKVGTYGLAAVAARHGVPFLIAAPRTTFDGACPDGGAIPIEFRSADEVGGFGGVRWAPAGAEAYNPAFDVTPAELIAGFVTERGVLRPPFGPAIEKVLEER